MLEFREIMVLDKNAEAMGVPTSTLMENAGSAVADFIKNTLIGSPKIKKSTPEIIIFCGPGNNGGDGFVAARYLTEGNSVKIVLTEDKNGIKTSLAKQNFDKIQDSSGIYIKPSSDEAAGLLETADVVVDAMLGVGITGALREPYTTYIKAIQSSSAVVVSVDAPTGLGTEGALKPDYTITFHDTKRGMDKSNSGEIITASIGIPEEAERYIGPGELVAYYPLPLSTSHKGQNGRLLIVGGGPYTGAPALAASAALRTGVDLVHIATPARSFNAIAGFSPNFIVTELKGSDGEFIVPSDIDKVLELSKHCDACVLGPGIGRTPDTAAFVMDFLSKSKIPIVLDADGLAALSSKGKNLVGKPSEGWVITPHFTEFSRLVKTFLNETIPEKADLANTSVLEEFCGKLSAELNAVVALKGKEDIVCDSSRLKINRNGNPGMTVGGTGDVLAGIIGGLAAKSVELYNSARIGVFINGEAGDMVWLDKGPALTATDIIESIPSVITKYIKF